MKILGLDFLHWVFPKNNNSFIELFKGKGVEFKYIEPELLYRNSRTIIVSHNHIVPDPYYRGFNLKNMIKVEMVKELEWYGWDKEVENQYILRLMGLIDWYYKIYEEEKPDYILTEGGLTYFSRAANEVARELGIGLICVENSFIENKIFIDFGSGFIVNRHEFARHSQDWLDTRFLTPQRHKEFETIRQEVFSNLKYKTNAIQELPTFKYSKSVVVPLQVCGDQVCVYDSKYNNEQFLKEIFWLANNKFQDWNIILRCHPVEEKWKQTAFTGDWIEQQNLPENIYLIRGAFDSVNTQELLKIADLVFVNNSQAGLEACLMEKPVVVFGDAFYGNKGFTLQYNRRHNWEKIKSNSDSITNIDAMKLWFIYFYKFLYNKTFQEVDKQRIIKRLGLKNG